MKIPVHRLKHALELVEPAVARKATLPITQNVLFQEGKLVATNLELAVAADMPEAAGFRHTLPYKLLVDVLRHIPNTEIASIERDGGTVTLTAGGTRVTLHGTDAADFPPLPAVPGERELVDGDRFLKALVAAVPYTATADSYPVLRAVCVTLGDVIEVAGTDGFRLAWQEIPLKLTGAGSGLKQLLVPRETVLALDKVWKRAIKPPAEGSAFIGAAGSQFPSPDLNQAPPINTGPSPSLAMARMAVAKRMMQVRFQTNQASFQFGEATVYTQLLVGEFPNYQQMIPEGQPSKVTFDAEETYRVVRMLAPVAAEGSNIIRMEWEGQAMKLSAQAEETGSVSSTIPVTAHGEPGRIAFNSKYLVEYLAGKYGLVLMESSSPSSPGRFTHAGSANMVLMPMFVAPINAEGSASIGAAPESDPPEEEEDAHAQQTEGP